MSAPSFTEEQLRRDIRPRFARVLARSGIDLANHSLGRPPDRMAEDVAAAVDTWYRDLDGAWDIWLDGRERFRSLVARLVGAPRADCIIPRASAGQGLRAVLNALPGEPRVVATDGEFAAEGADLLVLSTVMFQTGEVVTDLARRVADAHRAGARVLLDVYHHAGALPLDLAALDADFAIGGSYKYLRGGPGAGWLYVRPDLTDHLRTLDAGWFAQDQPFAWTRSDPPPQWPTLAPGGDSWLEATPAVLAPFQALAGLEFTLEMGVERLRAHNLWQKQILADLLARQGIQARGAGEDSGAFLTVPHAEAARLVAGLRTRGITTDARGRHLRLGPDLLNSDDDLARAAAALGEVLS